MAETIFTSNGYLYITVLGIIELISMKGHPQCHPTTIQLTPMSTKDTDKTKISNII